MKNYYQMLGIAAYSESVAIQRALLKAAEQQKISLEDLAEIKATLLNPQSKAQYDSAHRNHFPPEPVIIIDDHEEEQAPIEGTTGMAAKVGKIASKSLENRRTYKSQVARINKSIYILAAFFFGWTGVHHMLVGHPARGLIYFLLSCTGIGLLLTIPSAIMCVFHASRQIPDEHGFITVL